MANFGETLRRERELREISLRQIAEATKINIRYLEALEQNRFEVLPGGLFNKGFIRAYAAYIGVDGETMVNSYLATIAAPAPAGHPNGGGDPGLHRPSEVPLRRAAPAARADGGRFDPAPRADAARPDDARPVLARSEPARGEVPRPAAPPRVFGLERAAAPETSVAAPARAAILRESASNRQSASIRESTSEAATAAEEAAPRSRALGWILALVAGTALVFFVLGLLRGGPAPQRAGATSGSGAFPAETADAALPAPAMEPGDAPAADGMTAAAAPDAAAGLAAAGTSAAPPHAAPSGQAASPAIEPDRASLHRIEGGGGPEGVRLDRAASSGPAERRAAGSRGDGAAEPDAGGGSAGAPRAKRLDDAQAGFTAPAEPDAGARRAPAAMEVEIIMTGRTWLQVVCDGRTAVDHLTEPGELNTLRCRGAVRISTHDAGMVQVRVDGADCLPLGDPGAQAYGYTIRNDDHERICPRAPQDDRGF